MLVLLGMLYTTILLALAVKQVSMALMKGSMFEPLRRTIRYKMDDDVRGFETLNELFTCELCMTMQVSLWLVVVPTIWFGLTQHLEYAVVGAEQPLYVVTIGTFVGSFVYGMAVSAVALGLWRLMEYPAVRYEDTAYKLREAEGAIVDLKQEVARYSTRNTNLQGEINRLQDEFAQRNAPKSRQAKGKDKPSPVANGNGSTSALNGSSNLRQMLSIEEFRNYMNYVNHGCRGIGCGFSRRDCRQTKSQEWLTRWAQDDASRQSLVPQLKRILKNELPDYFRDHSENDQTIENEQAFRRLHQQVVEQLRLGH